MAEKTKQIIKLRLFIILLFLVGTVFAINIPWDKTCYTDSGECFNKETNLKRVIHHKISISSPQEIVCDWSDPNSNWKDCEVVMEIENLHDTDFPLPINPLKHRFKHSIKEMKVSYSKDYVNYAEEILNITCYEDLSDEEKLKFYELNESICHYNITKKSFYNWGEVGNLVKIPANSVIGIRLNFKSPILVKDGKYLRNQFNFTLQGLDREITLDPVISGCAILNSSGETYYLTADIINSATSCMYITANDVTLDCQGHLIDGNGIADHGIEVSRSSPQTTNIMIKNCIVKDWRDDNIYLKYANGNTLSNITASHSKWLGVYLIRSHSNTFSNIIANYNPYYGISLGESHSNNFSNLIANYNIYGGIMIHQSNSNTFSNITTNFNPNDGIEILASHSNTFSNTTTNFNSEFGFYVYGSCGLNTIRDSKIQNNAYGGIRLDLYGPYTPIGLNNIYNNLLNNTDNVYISGNTTNYWNTEKQSGTNIIGDPYIGGNYWTNSTGTGYSDTCTDADKDGFCDNPYELNSKNIDYLPLSDEYQPLGLPDITLTQEDISFSPEEPKEGETVTITATIHNIGERDAENILVRFYDGNPSTGTQINGDQTIATIPAGENKTASVEWTATLGSHEIYVVVDQGNKISEEDEGNNIASRRIEVCTHRVAYIPVRYTDGRVPTNTISVLTQEAEYVGNYYEQQSYGSVNLGNVFVFNEWKSLGKSFSDYGSPRPEDYNKWKKVIDDAIAISKIDPQDYDAIVVIQPENVRAFTDGKRTIQYELTDTSSAWAHELGHVLFGFRDYYEPYSYINPWYGGNIYYWGLMGKGGHMDPPAPIMSFNKISVGWLHEKIISPVGYGEYPINLLNELKFKDKITEYLTILPKYYIFEGRHPPDGVKSDPHSNYLFHLKEEEGVLLYFVTVDGKAYVVPYNEGDASRVTLHPKESYKDALAAVKFTADKRDSQLYVNISPYLPYGKKIISIFDIKWEIPAIGVISEPLQYENYFDIDLHIYAYNGQHIGMNYTFMEYEIQIPDTETSGNILGGGPEWISIPADTRIYYTIDATPAREWAEELNVTVENITASWQVVHYDDDGTRRESELMIINVSLEELVIPAITANIDIDPDTINLKSKGKWITTYIELPEGYDVSEIEINTVMLNFTVPAENNTKYGFVKNPEIKDRNNNGLIELMVKFDRPSVQEMLAETSGMVKLVVTGEVIDDDIPILFKGMDSIKIHTKGKKKE